MFNDKKVFIIAEAGVNHNGSIENALKMIDIAAEAGVDAIKFQTFKSEKLVSKYAHKAEYQKETTGATETQLEMLKKLELSEADHYKLKDYCSVKNILFLSSPFDLESIDFLKKLDIPIFKIASGEITNLPFLKKIGSFNMPVILSTGMCYMHEIEDAIEVLVKAGTERNKISLLHCNTEYPTPFEDVNLNAILSIRKKTRLVTGFSDHTPGIEIPIAAVAIGARIIEKHFTLDKNMEGPDHKASLNPSELKAMISAIRHIEVALGSGEKMPSPSETKNISVARKSIIAADNIKKGEIFTERNLTIKRPGNGISPMRWEEIIGTTSNRDYLKDELIEL